MLLIFCTAAFGIILSIYPAFLNDKGISDTGILLLYFVFGVSRVITLALAGKFVHRTSRTLVAASSAISAGLAISAFSNSIELFAVALVLMGFGFSIFFPLTLEIILSKTRKTISGKIIGAYETVFGIGWAIGPTVGGQITEYFGNESPYFVFFVIGIGITIIALLTKERLEPSRINSQT
jgi:MFS family permease